MAMDQLSFDDILDLSEVEIEKLMGEYEIARKEKLTFQKDALVHLPPNPPILLDCIHYIRLNNGLLSEGIFRVNGDSHIVESLRTSFAENVDLQDPLLSLQQSSALKTYDIATALKSYLRLLEEPLVPHYSYKKMKEALDKPRPIEVFKTEIAKIQEPNKSVFAYTMLFFQDVIANSAHNKMGSSNLATCLTMSVVRFEDNGNNHFAAMMEVGVSTKVIAMMLNEIDFTAFIKPERYVEMLKATTYKPTLLPQTLKEFREHPLYERFKLRYPVLPAVPPRHNHRQLPAPPPGKI